MPTGWDRDPNPSAPPPPGRTRPVTATPPPSPAKDADAPPLQPMESFVPEEPRSRAEDLVVSDHTRAEVMRAINLVRHRDVLYRDWGLSAVDPMGARSAINLYGPPGTGKTFCADAIANMLGRKILRVNYAELESKYVGETPKNITAAFRKASEANAVLFFDEADSILGKRLTEVRQSADHGVNVSRSVMLLQLDRFDGLVVFASNLASNYDGAFVRRIIAHVNFPLPDLACRDKLWRRLLVPRLPLGPGVSAETLARDTEGLSGGDMLNAVKGAACRAVARQGAERVVTLDDINAEVAAVRRAKREVGADAPVARTETVVQPSDLPDDVRARYDQAVQAQPGPKSA